MVSSPNLKIVPTHQGWTLNFAIANSIDQCQLAATHLSCHHGKNATRRRTALRSSRQAALSRSSPQLQLIIGPSGPKGTGLGPWTGPGPTVLTSILDGNNTTRVTTQCYCQASVQTRSTRAQRLNTSRLEPKTFGMYISNWKHIMFQCFSRPLGHKTLLCGYA